MDKSTCFDSGIEEFLKSLEFEKKKWQPNAIKLFDWLVEKLKNQNRDSAELKTEIHFKIKGKEHFVGLEYYKARRSKIRSLQTIYNTFIEMIPFEFEDEVWPHRMLTRILSSIFFYEDDFYVAFSPIAARALLQKEGVEQ